MTEQWRSSDETVTNCSDTNQLRTCYNLIDPQTKIYLFLLQPTNINYTTHQDTAQQNNYTLPKQSVSNQTTYKPNNKPTKPNNNQTQFHLYSTT